MNDAPVTATVAGLVDEPARASILAALLDGDAFTAVELAHNAGIPTETATGHLARLGEGGLVATRQQGAHRYFMLAGPSVAEMVRRLIGPTPRRRPRTGPRDPALRHARACYGHLAGDLGVALFDGLVREGTVTADAATLTEGGRARMEAFGIDTAALARAHRPVCRACLDWSLRRTHLAGGLGAALLDRFEALGWSRRVPGTRIVAFTPDGERQFTAKFVAPQPARDSRG